MHLRAWLECRGDEPGPLFTSMDRARKGDGRLTDRGVRLIMAKLGFHPHGLRHAGITTALDATGGDVRRVQRFSRHANVATVLIYDDAREDLGGQVAGMVAGRIGRR